MGNVIALYASSTVEPAWDAAAEVIQAVDASMLDKLYEGSDSWGTIGDEALIVELGPGSGEALGAARAQELLHADLATLRDALDSPPEALSTITFVHGAIVHYFEERELDSALGDAIDRLDDFDVLNAAGLMPGSW